MKVAYVVTCSIGEYDQHRVRLVQAFATEDDAEAFADQANAWLELHNLSSENGGSDFSRHKRLEALGVPAFDPKLYLDYSGAHYDWLEVPLANGLVLATLTKGPPHGR